MHILRAVGPRVGVAAAVGKRRGRHHSRHRDDGEGVGPFCQPDHPVGVSLARRFQTAADLARGAVGDGKPAGQGGRSAVVG